MEEHEEQLQSTRELVDGRFHNVFVSKDGNVRVDTGEDDQLPDEDGIAFTRPIVTAEMIGSSVYRYRRDCGRCGETLSTGSRYCQHCGQGVAHYVFAMGFDREECFARIGDSL